MHRIVVLLSSAVSNYFSDQDREGLAANWQFAMNANFGLDKDNSIPVHWIVPIDDHGAADITLEVKFPVLGVSHSPNYNDRLGNVLLDLLSAVSLPIPAELDVVLIPELNSKRITRTMLPPGDQR